MQARDSTGLAKNDNSKGLDKQNIVATTTAETCLNWQGAGFMRLVCPNCDAQYELAEGTIPAEGRDVQCSNCGHAWFQQSLEAEAARLAEENLFESPEDASARDDDNFEAELAASLASPIVEVEADPAPEPIEPEPPVEIQAAEVIAQVAPVAVFDGDEIEEAANLPPQFDAPTPLPRRTMDESLIAVLRE